MRYFIWAIVISVSMPATGGAVSPEERERCERGLMVLGKDRLGQPPTALSARQIAHRLSDNDGILHALKGGLINWDSFASLEETSVQIAEILSRAPGADFVARFEDEPLALELRQRYIEAGKGISASCYGTTGCGMLMSYRKALLALSAPVGLWFFGTLPALPEDTVKEAQYELAREHIRRLEGIVGKSIPTTGYETIEKFREAAKNLLGFKLLQQDKFELAMRRPERGRWWIERVGFHNQNVTHSSNGLLNPARRAEVESARMKLTTEEFASFDFDLRPKYGVLLPSRENLNLDTDHSDQYGEDIYLFKKSIRDRVTFTLGDSLNWHRDAVKSGKWNEHFIPYRFMELLSPFLEGITTFSPRHDPLIAIQMNSDLHDRTYLELQYFGPMNLDDVEGFIYTDSPPAGSFLEALRSRGIKIYKTVAGKVVETL